MRMFIRFTLALFVMFTATTVALAQTPFSPDDRYKGYLRELIQWPTAQPDLAACQKDEYYEPVDTHLCKYVDRIKVAKIEEQQQDTCRWMLTRNKWRWVLRPKGTKIAKDAQGRDLFDYGSAAGEKCCNPSPFGVPIVSTVSTPPPAPTPAPPPTPPQASPPARTTSPPTPEPPLIFRIPPPPTPPATKTSAPPPRPRRPARSKGPSVSAGIGYVVGSVHSNYEDPIPSSGDVPQRHYFAAFVPFIRVDQGSDHGFFGSFSGNVLGSTSGMEFQDITGAWNTKKHDQDNSRDNKAKVKVGYKHSVGDYITVGVFGGWSRLCLCENYVAQGATTTTERSYQGVVLGVESVGSTSSEDHQIKVTVNGEFGPSLTRKSWTHQTYPGINFPTVNHAHEDAKSFGFRAEGTVQVFGPVHASVAYDYLGIGSTRPDTFTAHERVNVNAVTIGLNIRLGM